MIIRGDEPVFIHRRTANGVDEYGNETFTTEEILVRDALFAYSGSAEAEDVNRNMIDYSLTLYLPHGTLVEDGDIFEIRETMWEMDGVAQTYPVAVGLEAGVVVRVRKRRG